MFTVEHKGDVIVNVTTVDGDITVTPAAMAGIEVGMYLVATGVPDGTYVTRVDTTTIKISAAATASGTVSGAFSQRPDVLSGIFFGMDKANYGGSCGSYIPPRAQQDVEIRVVEDTGGGAGAIRFYVYANGTWNYVTMTKVT